MQCQQTFISFPPFKHLLVRGMEPAVEVKQLVKVYAKEIRALDQVDLTIEAGKVFALLGPNGAGKTTLMRILTTQIRPTAGAARVFGLDVIREGAKVRRLVSYVPQEMSVWTDISGYENLLVYAKIFGLPASDRKRMIAEAMDKLGLGPVANNMVKIYSGGMVRRLELACALIIKPRILFLDEPTIGLDPSARSVVWKELTAFKKDYGITIFFNTHYMDEADHYSDEIAIINKGQIIKRGTADELKHSIGGEVIEVTTDGLEPNAAVLDSIRALASVMSASIENSEIRITVQDAETALPGIMDALRQGNIPAKKIAMTKPTLDDVFLKYAGTRLDVGGRISDVTHMRTMIKKG